MSEAHLTVGQRVVTKHLISEGQATPSEEAEFPESGYIHAHEREKGTVEYAEEDRGYWHYTVRFDRTGTACVVGQEEIKPLWLRSYHTKRR